MLMIEENRVKEILFSIIIPVYNIQNYVQIAFRSIINQDYKNYEIIMVDDGSSDNSGDLCDKLVMEFRNVKVIHKENGGLSDTRNVGIKNARGKYIIFLDGDDGLAIDALKNLAMIIAKENPDIIINRRASFTHSVENYQECKYYFDKKRLNQLSSAKQYRYIQKYKDCWLGAWLFVIKRTFILDNNLFFYKGIFHEDEEWVPRVFFAEGKLSFNNNLLYLYRINREGGITATYNIKREFDLLKIIELLSQEFNSQKYSDDIRRCIRQRIQSIYFKVVHELRYYRNNDDYINLVFEIGKKSNVLRYARKYNHIILKWLIKTCGVEKASKIIGII